MRWVFLWPDKLDVDAALRVQETAVQAGPGKPQKTFFVFTVGHGLIVPASGPEERRFLLLKVLVEELAKLHLPAHGSTFIVPCPRKQL